MAHLVCVTHGKRSVVITVGDKIYSMPVVRHRTNHDSECDSKLLTTNSRIISPMEVVESRYDSGVAQWIADRDNHAEVSRIIVALSKRSVPDAIIGSDIENLKSMLSDRWQNRALKRVGRRNKQS